MRVGLYVLRECDRAKSNINYDPEGLDSGLEDDPSYGDIRGRDHGRETVWIRPRD